MYAIIEVAGQQFKVEKGQKIYVHRLENAEGSEVSFEQVLLIDNEGKITIGEPVIEGAFVEGKVLTHVKGDKVIVFKKKRRKGYQKRNGHRQQFSHIEILSLNEKGAPRKSAAAKAAPAPAAEKPVKEAAPVAEKKPAAKPAKAETRAEKAPAAKKAAPKAAPKAAAEKKPTATKAAPKAAADKKPAAKKAAPKAAPKAAAKKPSAAKGGPKKTGGTKAK